MRLIIFFILLLIIIQKVYAGEDKDWIRDAKCYVSADNDMRAHGNVEGQFMNALTQRDKCVKCFGDDIPPNEAEIKELLASKCLENRVIASVGTALSGIKSKDIMDKIVENVVLSESYELTRYSLLALNNYDDEDLKRYEHKLFESVKLQKKKEDVVGEIILFLANHPNENTAIVLKYLVVNSEYQNIKLLAYTALKKIGLEYAKEALVELKRTGNEKSLKLLENAEGENNPLK